MILLACMGLFASDWNLPLHMEELCSQVHYWVGEKELEFQIPLVPSAEHRTQNMIATTKCGIQSDPGSPTGGTW